MYIKVLLSVRSYKYNVLTEHIDITNLIPFVEWMDEGRDDAVEVWITLVEATT